MRSESAGSTENHKDRCGAAPHEQDEVRRAMEVGLFLEYVERNPGKGCVRRMPRFLDDVVYEVFEGLQQSWNECEIFEYPNNRWVLATTFRHVEADWLPDQPRYEELAPSQAAQKILDSRVELSLDDLIRLTELAAAESTGQRGFHWNRDRGELTIDGQVARKVTKPNQSQNIMRVLDEFQRKSWPEQIQIKFLEGEPGKEVIRETVRSLNRGAQGIVFEADGTGGGIRFRLTREPESPGPAVDDIPF